MSTPQQPATPNGEKQKTAVTPEERRKQKLVEMETIQIPLVLTWGERLLPYFLAAMDTCWIGAILIYLAALGFFQTHALLLPLWSPFLLIAGSQSLASYLERRAAIKAPAQAANKIGTQLPGTTLFFGLAALAIVLLLWLSIYSDSAYIFDPRWLLTMLNDILLFNQITFRILGIIISAVYFCWRGLRLSQRELEPSDALRGLLLGMGMIVAVILLRTGIKSSSGIQDETTLILLIPCFLFFALSAHALARITFVRRTHPVGREVNIIAQERAILLVIGTMGVVFILIGFLAESFVTPEMFTPALSFLGTAYDLLARGLASILVFLATPFFWLISLINPKVQPPKIPTYTLNQPDNVNVHTAPPQSFVIFVFIIKFILPILVVVLLIVLARLLLRRRRIRIEPARRMQDLSESLWSWELFLQQLRLFLHALFGRFLAKKDTSKQYEIEQEAIKGVPAVRSIREIYRALLKWAAYRGLARKKDETPYEFQQRLNKHVVRAETQLAIVTEAYTATRYGELVPDQEQVVQVQQMWTELEQKNVNP